MNNNDILHNFNKNYIREVFLDLERANMNIPFIIRGRYKHNNGNSDWCTFITIRPVIPGYTTSSLCNHINIRRTEISKYYNLNENDERKSFIIIAVVDKYEKDGVERGCVHLYEKFSIPSIILRDEASKYINKSIIDRCYKFDDKFKKSLNKQSYLDLYN